MQTCPECVHEIALRQEWSARAQRAEAEVDRLRELLNSTVAALYSWMEGHDDEVTDKDIKLLMRAREAIHKSPQSSNS
jgi:hypothetical protein